MKKLESRELRIGNWVSMAQYGVQQISSYNIYKLNLMELGTKVADYYYLIEPIPLTEEWIVKFGFYFAGHEKRTFLQVYVKDGVKLRLSNSGILYYQNIPIKTVHRLQNLYFALTGEELTLKQ